MDINDHGTTVGMSKPTYDEKRDMSLFSDLIPTTRGSYVTLSSENDVTQHPL
jgi:hypothetical protein